MEDSRSRRYGMVLRLDGDCSIEGVVVGVGRADDRGRQLVFVVRWIVR